MRADASLPLSRLLDVESARRAGDAGTIEASEVERAALAALLDLTALDALRIDWRVEPQPRGRLMLSGRIAARLVQACVVTLGPVEATIDDAVSVAFWPAAQIGEAAAGPDDALADTPEAIAGETIDIGRVLAEEFAVRIEPFPRAPGATLGEMEAGDAASRHPFAALQQLKR